MADLKLWKWLEPTGVYVDFLNVVPGFARTNTPRRNWNEKQRARVLPNGERYVLPPYKEMKGHFVQLHDWTITCKMDGGEISYTIPNGQSTDFASIPSTLRSLLSPLSNTVYAAVLHDYLYRSPEDTIAKATTRHEADRIFYYGMKACGVNRLIALMMYWGVRLGGKSSYRR